MCNNSFIKLHLKNLFIVGPSWCLFIALWNWKKEFACVNMHKRV